ncbi:MAG: hypothetical protein KJO04_02855, partial [Bacteroidia bacterium]|nr:hypothetical protein [Bacteroidia bacterium]
KVVLIMLTSLFVSTASFSQEEATESIQYYRVLAIKFKFGKADEGVKRGMELFKQALTDIGRENMVFRGESGPHDLLVFDPVSKDSPFSDDWRGDHFKAMIEIMGSQEALMEEIEAWSELVESQEVYYYKQIG